MKKLVALVLFIVSELSVSAQVNIYDPRGDIKKDIVRAVDVASKSGEYIFLQIG